LNVTVLEPTEPPKRLPLIVTDIPSLPNVGEMLVIVGAPVYVNVIPLLCSPWTTTTTGPVPVPVGAGAVIWVLPQAVGVAGCPSNVTALFP